MSLLKNEVPGPYHKPRTRETPSLTPPRCVPAQFGFSDKLKRHNRGDQDWLENVLPREVKVKVDYRIV